MPCAIALCNALFFCAKRGRKEKSILEYWLQTAITQCVGALVLTFPTATPKLQPDHTRRWLKLDMANAGPRLLVLETVVPNTLPNIHRGCHCSSSCFLDPEGKVDQKWVCVREVSQNVTDNLAHQSLPSPPHFLFYSLPVACSFLTLRRGSGGKFSCLSAARDTKQCCLDRI